MIKNSGVIDFSGLSDYCLVFLTHAVKRSKFKAKKVTCRDFRKFNAMEFNSDVEKIAWDSLQTIQTDNDLDPLTKLNNQIALFENYFLDTIDKHAPIREVIIKKPVHLSWMTHGQKRSLQSSV